MNKRQTGSEWEQKAADYLAHNGMCIRERNFRNRQGEIDIIGTHDGYLVFAEVKYRSSPSMGHAAEAVDFRKQKQICRVADYYRLRIFSEAVFVFFFLERNRRPGHTAFLVRVPSALAEGIGIFILYL